MPIPKYLDTRINPDYVQDLEKKLQKVNSVLIFMQRLIDQQELGPDPQVMYIAALKDICRHIR